MSKAFTKESDGDSQDNNDDVSAAVPGGKNYITPAGAEKLKAELRHLKNVERPEVTKTVSWAAGNGDRSENGDYIYGKKRLREIDKRLRFLAKRIESAEVIDPATVKVDHVMFGATVTIRFEDDSEKTYSIVGLDEVDVNKGRISWMSPLARSLMKAKEGDVVNFQSPKGLQEIEITKLVYKALKSE